MLDDYEKCCAVLVGFRGCNESGITDALIKTLVVAEDHRNDLHHGVDPLAILRTIKVRIFQGERQGVSTIEQQLVRTITGRYEKTPFRKVREQLLAVMLNSRFSKREMSSCYLKIACYGASLVGYKGIEELRSQGGVDLDVIVVAHLKYPRALNSQGVMIRKHAGRVRHIKMLLVR